MKVTAMPAAWIAFLAAAETYFEHYGGVTPAVAALRQGLDPAERAEVGAFLRRAATSDEAACLALTAIRDEIVAANSFRPDRCQPFSQEASIAFDGE